LVLLNDLTLHLGKSLHEYMARKRKDDHIRTLTKIAGGKSYCVTLPISIVRDLQWESSQKVSVKRWGKKIIIQDMSADGKVKGDEQI